MVCSASATLSLSPSLLSQTIQVQSQSCFESLSQSLLSSKHIVLKFNVAKILQILHPKISPFQSQTIVYLAQATPKLFTFVNLSNSFIFFSLQLKAFSLISLRS